MSNGHIDENYEDYMNYFYDDDLKKEDKLFIRTLLSNSKNKTDKQLRNIRSIIEVLKDEDYKRKGILNLSLSEYFIKEDMKSRLSEMFSVSKQNDNYGFVLDLYKNILRYDSEKVSKSVQLFTNALIPVWHDFYSYVIMKNEFKRTSDNSENENLNEALLERLVCDGLIYLDNDNVVFKKGNSILVEFINQHSSLLEKVSEETWKQFSENGIANLNKMDVQLKKFDHEKMYRKLVDSIIENNLYKLNYENLEEIALYKGVLLDRSDNDTFKHGNLSRLMNSDIIALETRIKNNLSEYVEIYLEFSENDIRDDKECVLMILNSGDVENKEKYIQSMQYHVENLEEVDYRNIWKVLIEKRKVSSTIQNIVRYFKEFDREWKQELIDFVNNTEQDLKVTYEDIIKEFDKITFFQSTLSLNNLKDDRYEDIIGKSNYNLVNDQFTIDGLEDSKVTILMKYDMISMNAVNLENFRKSYSHLLIEFIQSDISGYLELVNPQVDEKEIIGLLNSDLGKENLESILSKISGSKKISLKKIEKNNSAMKTLIENHLKVEDHKLLFTDYSQYEESAKNQIVKIAIEHMQTLLKEDVDKELVISLLNSNINIEQRKKLLIKKIDSFNFEDILSVEARVGIIGSSSFRKIETNKRPTYEVNELNRTILSRLKELDVILSVRANRGKLEATTKS